MGRKASGQEKVDRITRSRPNGDTYVYERVTRYDPTKGYYVTVSSTLVGKLKPGSTDKYDLDMTRPKKKPSETGTSGEKGRIDAVRKHVGMINIVKRISEIAGIEKELAEVLPDDEGLAKKIATLAWYAFSTDGQSWPGVESWTRRYQDDVPYPWTLMTGDIYHDVFVSVSQNESIKQGVFAQRIKEMGKHCKLIALDSTTIVVNTKNPEKRGKCRKCKHKDGTFQITVKIVFFYCIDTRIPIAFSVIPSSIPDSQTVEYALTHIKGLGADKDIEIVFDNGYCTDGNICRCLLEKRHFVTRMEADTVWVAKEIENIRSRLEHGGGEIVDCDYNMTCTKIPVHRKFSLRGQGKKDEQRSAEADVNLFILFSTVNKAKDEVYLRQTYSMYRNDLLNGVALGKDRDKIEAFAKKFMLVEYDKDGKVRSVSPKMDAWENAMKHAGYLVLLADKEDDLNTALIKFRKREYIEEMIKNFETHVGGDKTRVWDDDTLDGEVMVWFEALSMHEAFETKINYLKSTLGIPDGDREHDQIVTLDTERELSHWLQKTSLQNILGHFDAEEYVYLKNKDKNKEVEWTTSQSKRDLLFLDKLGVQ